VIPPEQNAAFVCAMEDTLEVYHRPYDATRPLVCVDEASKQLVKETRPPRPLAPGHPATADYEYERNGTANLFMMFEPLGGQRHVKVTAHRTAVDYAHVVRELCLSWGVVPTRVRGALRLDGLIAKAQELLRREGVARGSPVVVTMGYPQGKGLTNMVLVAQV